MLRIDDRCCGANERLRQAELEHATRRLRILATATVANAGHDRLGQSILPVVHLSSLLAKGAYTTLRQAQVQTVAVSLICSSVKMPQALSCTLRKKEALLRCHFLCSVGERPRIATRYVGLSRHLRLRLQIASGRSPGRKDVNCAAILGRERCDIARICVRMFAVLAARIADPWPTGVAGRAYNAGKCLRQERSLAGSQVSQGLPGLRVRAF